MEDGGGHDRRRLVAPSPDFAMPATSSPQTSAVLPAWLRVGGASPLQRPRVDLPADLTRLGTTADGQHVVLRSPSAESAVRLAVAPASSPVHVLPGIRSQASRAIEFHGESVFCWWAGAGFCHRANLLQWSDAVLNLIASADAERFASWEGIRNDGSARTFSLPQGDVLYLGMDIVRGPTGTSPWALSASSKPMSCWHLFFLCKTHYSIHVLAPTTLDLVRKLMACIAQ